MYKKLYQQIKHFKVYVGRYGCTMLIKNADYINSNILSIVDIRYIILIILIQNN